MWIWSCSLGLVNKSWNHLPFEATHYKNCFLYFLVKVRSRRSTLGVLNWKWGCGWESFVTKGMDSSFLIAIIFCLVKSGCIREANFPLSGPCQPGVSSTLPLPLWGWRAPPMCPHGFLSDRQAELSEASVVGWYFCWELTCGTKFSSHTRETFLGLWLCDE